MVRSQQSILERSSLLICTARLPAEVQARFCIFFLCSVHVHTTRDGSLAGIRLFRKDFSLYAVIFFCLFWVTLALFSCSSNPKPVLHFRNSSKSVKCINSTPPCFENHVLDLHIFNIKILFSSTGYWEGRR